MKKRLTLILSFYKPKKNNLEYWTKIYNKLNVTFSDVDIFFLIDGTNIQFEGIENDDHIFFFKENQGKFKCIYNFIKMGLIKSSHFKICDPDDYISLKNLRKFKSRDINAIYRFTFTPFSEGPQTIEDSLITNLINEKKNKQYDSFGTSWTILPTAPVFNDHYYSQNKIYYHDDQLFGYLCYANGSKIKRKKIKFYYYITEIGIGSSKNIVKMLEFLPNTFKEIKSFLVQSGKKNPLSWPNDYAHYYTLRDRFFKKNEKNFQKINILIEDLKKIDAFNNDD